ncbi:MULTISPECIES: Panacea domain-containing protein [unclassified Rickettsia]|uniref:Panacea domain-containing protein n=1 Tax=unclassified Rickettsia TaxID=114295 RepID=UPI000A40CC78|nr:MULTISPECIES: type II toxin-antitoxin system antitoxin SocA domain-containing protein [unclassified Rickettsia]
MTENHDLQEQMDKKDDILSAIDVAKYLLILVDREAGDAITQLKLQKLMYIAQGIHLVLYDKPLFKEEIEASQHGPVVRELYHEFKGY